MTPLLELSLTNPLVIVALALAAIGTAAWGVRRIGRTALGVKLQRSLSLAVKSLWLHKLRAFLSVLGIIIGTSAVISLMSFGEGSMQDALEDIKRQGATNIIIRSVKPPSDSATAQRTWVTTYGLVERDLKRFETLGDAIGRDHAGRPRIVPLRVFPSEARFRERMVSNARVIGTTPMYADVNKFEMAGGRFLDWSDDDGMKNYCVLGADVADRLLPFENPLGKTVMIRGFDFVIVGVIKERMPTGGTGGSQAAEEFDNDVYIPLSTSTARFGRIITVRSSGAFTREQVEYNQITLTVNAEVDSPAGRAKVQAVGEAIKNLLDYEHRDKKDWAVTIPLDRLEEAERAQNRFTKLMAMVASISLLVGGIGIMNIMLATVTERTREIGIRRALGAKQKDITLQFLVEAVVQTTIGGLCGVVLGVLSVYTIPAAWGVLLDWGWFTGTPLPAKLHVGSIFLSLFFSIVVGMAFGLYPAWRAAKLDPIEALRHD